jgi:predicted dehydrogenase
MDRLRLAIVGCGNISRLNVPGYLQHPRGDVVALCDTLPERAKRRAAEWGITPRLYSDLAQVLDDPAVDAVELLTPT